MLTIHHENHAQLKIIHFQSHVMHVVPHHQELCNQTAFDLQSLVFGEPMKLITY